jgi:hypothetical protein
MKLSGTEPRLTALATTSTLIERKWSKQHCEYLRIQCKQRFNKVISTWVDSGMWALPHRTRFLLNYTEGQRINNHIVDTTHITALRSYVAGFLEGNTSASRPWYRIQHADPYKNQDPKNKEWLDTFTRRTLIALNNSNFYYAAGEFYYDFGVFNTGAHYVDELKDGLHFHNLAPGGYFVLNNNIGVADVMVREFVLTVKALVDTYGTKTPTGDWDWSNFSMRVKKLYTDGNYSQKVNVVHIIMPNQHFDPTQPQAMMNKQWVSLTYELGGSSGQYYEDGQEFGVMGPDPNELQVFLKKSASRRKPFIVGRSSSTENFEYGEKGPTLDALGLIKSLNKKAIGKDIALDQMIKPAVQGPAHLRKSYITTAPNSFVPMDPQGMKDGGLKPIFQINPAIQFLVGDVEDLRKQVSKHYFEDYLTYLSMNPKTRTATEANAVVKEQQLIIGPMLQSLNWTYNNPVVEFVMDYVLHEDPYLPPAPKGLQGEFLRTEYISVFAQAQKSADIPNINQYVQAVQGLAEWDPKAIDKFNVDKYLDLLEDRLYLPAGLNNPQTKTDAIRAQAMAMQQRQQAINEHLPAIAGAAKDVAAAHATLQGAKPG